MGNFTWFPAMVLALWAGWWDWRSSRIPNWLTVTGLLTGLASHSILGGWNGAKIALVGAALPLVVLLPPVLLRGLGAGDWKLMGALGALLGWPRILSVLLASVFLAGLLAVAQLVREKRVKTALGNLWKLISGFFFYGLYPHPDISLDNPTSSSVPFGVAAAAGTLLCYVATAVR